MVMCVQEEGRIKESHGDSINHASTTTRRIIPIILPNLRIITIIPCSPQRQMAKLLSRNKNPWTRTFTSIARSEGSAHVNQRFSCPQTSSYS
jgi:hypothetical protein